VAVVLAGLRRQATFKLQVLYELVDPVCVIHRAIALVTS
jgi:hypothetical protein